MKDLHYSKLKYILFIVLIMLEIFSYFLEKEIVIKDKSKGIFFYIDILNQSMLWYLTLISIIQLIVWLLILNKVKLGIAYAFSSISVPATMLVSQIVFHEDLNVKIWIGGLLVFLGTVFLSLKNTNNAKEKL